MGDPPTSAMSVPRIVVAVCTFRRNEPLRRLLDALGRNALSLGKSAEVGVVIVDDNPDQAAQPVVGEYEGQFALGIHYRWAGQGNISIARNLALNTAIDSDLLNADWVAMTDDDCEPVDDWLLRHLQTARRTSTDIVTGPCHLSGTEGAPRWLVDQPFLEDAQFRFADGERLSTAATNNSFIRAEPLRKRPELRFDPDLGVLGGEDMVFFRTAHRHGLTIAYASTAAVQGHEPPERWTMRYQVRSRFWLGNTEFVTNQRLGEANRIRWFLRGIKALGTALLRPTVQLINREPPQARYAVASGARALGMMAGAAGLRVRHH